MSEELPVVSMLGTLYCHDCDPNSLKLLLFVLEAGLLSRMSEVVHVTKHNAATVQTDLLANHSDRDTKNQSKGGDAGAADRHTEYGIFPVFVCDADNSLLTGADRIINMFIDDVLQDRRIDWNQMVVFNFFSCGMKMEMDMLKMENKQYLKSLVNYEQLQVDYQSLQHQVPNILSIFRDEVSPTGLTFKKLQLEHQAALSQLLEAREENRVHSAMNDQLQEEIYSLKKDNIDLLEEKNELRLLQEEELDRIQQESEGMTIHLTEQSNSQIKKLNDIIHKLKSLVVKEIVLNTTGQSFPSSASGPLLENKGESDREAASPSTVTSPITGGDDCDQDIEELRYLLKTSSYIPDLRASLADREEEIAALKERNSILEAKLTAIESSLRE